MRKKTGAASNEKDPQTIDGKTGKVDPPPPNPNLSNARSLRLEMARLYRQWLKNELDGADMYKGIWALGEMLKAYGMQEIERRVTGLEERHTLKGGTPLLSTNQRRSQ